MGWYEEHLHAVRKRWQEKKTAAPNTVEFMEKAKEYLLSIGWSEEEVKRILK